jgi:hypothetical protein
MRAKMLRIPISHFTFLRANHAFVETQGRGTITIADGVENSKAEIGIEQNR